MNEQVLNFSDADHPILQVSATTKGDATHYKFCGVVDAQAKTVLEKLGQTPPQTRDIVLDFAEVGRINSMGLALLLKLLNAWEKAGLQIRVVNLNRMAAILFKITGLGRFLDDGDSTGPAATKSAPEAKKPVQAAPQREKLHFFAHLQTSQQLNGWFLFNTYLQRQLQQAIQFQAKTLAERSPAEEIEAADLVFASPFETCRLIRRRGFEVIAKPLDETDEVVILAHIEDKRALKEVSRPKVALAGKDSFT